VNMVARQKIATAFPRNVEDAEDIFLLVALTKIVPVVEYAKLDYGNIRAIIQALKKRNRSVKHHKNKRAKLKRMTADVTMIAVKMEAVSMNATNNVPFPEKKRNKSEKNRSVEHHLGHVAIRAKQGTTDS